MEDCISRKSEAYKSLKVKVLRSLGEDLVPLVTEALKHSCHPTLADAALELSRSELLFVALLQALATKNTVMSGRLLLAAEEWLLFPRITAYMGGKLHTEFKCTNEFVGGAAEFAHTLHGTGLIAVPQDILVYLNELARNVRNEIKQRERALRREASAEGDPQEVDDPESQDGNSKRARRRRGHRQRRSSDASQGVESRANEVTANMQDQAVQTMETTHPKSASAIASSPPQTTPTAASSAMQTSVASASSPPQTTPTAASSAMQTSVASFSSLQFQRATEWLFTAIESEDLLAIRCAIISGADINGRNADGFTPLHLTAARGLFKAMSVLLMANANTEVEDNAGNRPLHTAAENGQDRAVALLVAAGADLHAKGWGGSTPAFSAFSHDSTVLLLDSLSLSQMGRGRAVSNAATKALRGAVKRNDPQAVRAAIENGADIEERRASDGRTALHLAAFHGSVEVSCVLLRAGADKEAVDRANNRPLHLAAYHGHEAVVLLAVAGADLHSRGCNDQTPLQQAVYYNCHATAALLRALGG